MDVFKQNEGSNIILPALGTVHVHPGGISNSNFLEGVFDITANGGDREALRKQKQQGKVMSNGYGIVISGGTNGNLVTIYNEKRNKVSMPLNIFLNIGK